MSTPNPLNPQGSLLEQRARRTPNLPVVVLIFLAIHVVVLGGILMAGCQRNEPKTIVSTPPETPLPPMSTNDFFPPISPVASNPPVALVPLTPAPAPAPLVQPLPAPTPELRPAPEPPAARMHVVAKGESFYSMSKKYNVGMKAIEAANPGVDPIRLKLGQKIQIPAPAERAPRPGVASGGGENGYYTVKSGDYLGKIAKDHRTTVAKLREANGLKTDQIKVGQKLKLPAGGASPEPPAPAAATPASVPALPPLLPPLDAPRAPGQP